MKNIHDLDSIEKLPCGQGRAPLGTQCQAYKYRPTGASKTLLVWGKKKILSPTQLIHSQLIKKPQEKRTFFEGFCLWRIIWTLFSVKKPLGPRDQSPGGWLTAPLKSRFHMSMSLMLKMFSSTGTISAAVRRSKKMFYNLFTLVKKCGPLSCVLAVINCLMPSVGRPGVNLTFSVFWGHISETICGTEATFEQR